MVGRRKGVSACVRHPLHAPLVLLVLVLRLYATPTPAIAKPESPRRRRDRDMASLLASAASAMGELALRSQRSPSPGGGGMAAKPNRGTRASLQANGYPLEAHVVRTDDGYLLGVFRIPRPGRPVVFLMHGLILASADYVTLGRRGGALPLLLHDAGYDVWMGNARGNMESRRHETLPTDDIDFWDFSFHEIGVHDLPSSIDYVLAATNQSSLHYVGHSQGTTTFFVMGSERPEYMAKVKSFHAMAPVAFIRDMRSDLLQFMHDFELPVLFRRIGAVEVLPNTPFLSTLKQLLCSPGVATQSLCFEFMFQLSGFDSLQVNSTMLPAVFANFPSGSAMKQLEHFCQQLRLKELAFNQFDYGAKGNLARYGQVGPPAYNLSRITPPTYLTYTDNDILAVKSNVDALVRKLPNIAPGGVRRVPLAVFSHLDFVFGRDAKKLVYDHVLDNIRRHEGESRQT